MYLAKAGANHIFSKLLLCTPEDVKEILQSAKEELLSKYEEEKDCPESCFIEQALERISLRQEMNLVTDDDTNISSVWNLKHFHVHHSYQNYSFYQFVTY